jgi:hypothetical protein
MIIASRWLDQIDKKRINRLQVQGSTFRVKDKEGIKDPKFSFKLLILPINAILVSNFLLDLTKLTLFL